jgi:hypothetical protein
MPTHFILPDLIQLWNGYAWSDGLSCQEEQSYKVVVLWDFSLELGVAFYYATNSSVFLWLDKIVHQCSILCISLSIIKHFKKYVSVFAMQNLVHVFHV